MMALSILFCFIYFAAVHYFIFEYGSVEKVSRVYLYIGRFIVLLVAATLSVLSFVFFLSMWGSVSYLDLFFLTVVSLVLYIPFLLLISFLYRKALIVSKKSDLKKKKFVVVSLTTALLFLVASVSNIWAFYLLHFDSAVPVNYELVGDYKIPQNVYQDYERKVSGGENYASLELKYCTGYGQAFVISENYHFASAKYYYSLSGKLAYQLDLSDTSPISYGIGESLSKMKCESLKNFNNGGIPKVELPV